MCRPQSAERHRVASESSSVPGRIHSLIAILPNQMKQMLLAMENSVDHVVSQVIFSFQGLSTVKQLFLV